MVIIHELPHTEIVNYGSVIDSPHICMRNQRPNLITPFYLTRKCLAFIFIQSRIVLIYVEH